MDGVGRVNGEGSEELTTGSAADRRRDSLFMSALLKIVGAAGEYEVRVRNLSAGGLMVEFDRPIAPGAAVTLDMKGLGELTGTVAWSTRGRVGIAFDEAIDPKLARNPVGTGRMDSAYPKPILVARGPRR